MIDKRLQWAFDSSNFAAVQALVAEKPERLKQRDEYGQTLLIVAVLAWNRNLECIEALLEAGADVNGRNRAGFTALHVVIWNEYFEPPAARSDEIITLLLDARADLEDDQNAHACTPLMTAVRERVCDDARWLLARGANPNKFIPEKMSSYAAGWSLLSSAWLEPEMMQILIEGGADVNLRNALGQTVIEEIEGRDAGKYEADKQKSLKLLRQAQPLASKDSVKTTPLYQAS